MKISVCGKGGSGKSTIVTLLAKGAKERGYRVLVVDSDESNSGLYRMLGFDRAPNSLMDLVGGKKSVQQRMKADFSYGQQEYEMNIMRQNEILITKIPSQYVIETNGIGLVNTGKILQFLEGCACSHGVMTREFLGKLILKEDELVIIDMEAGIEHFGRGIEGSIDSVLIVVEPSFESLEIAQKIKDLAIEAKMSNIWTILNKITSGEIALKLSNELEKKGISVIGSVGYDPEIFQSCLGGFPLCFSTAENDVKKILNQLLKDTNEIKR
jgi:CO dehydrogenase maturation factor